MPTILISPFISKSGGGLTFSSEWFGHHLLSCFLRRPLPTSIQYSVTFDFHQRSIYPMYLCNLWTTIYTNICLITQCYPGQWITNNDNYEKDSCYLHKILGNCVRSTDQCFKLNASQIDIFWYFPFNFITLWITSLVSRNIWQIPFDGWNNESQVAKLHQEELQVIFKTKRSSN